MTFELPSLNLPKKSPGFGHALLPYFLFSPGYVCLNHGSYGSLPKPVFEFSTTVARQIEENPDQFMRVDLVNVVRDLREEVAPLINVGEDEIVFVPNASHGINTVLRNLEWHPDDIMIGHTTTYNAVERVITYLHDIPPHPRVSTFKLTFPTSRADILASWKRHLQSLKADLAQRQSALGEGAPKLKIVAVVDALISNPGIWLPWQEMVKICKEEGVISVVDAAHAIGQEVGIDLKKVDPDFWISNCHKWLFAKRGCAVLYVPKRNQHLIKSPIPTPAAYHSSTDPEPSNFQEMFGWNGTVDHTPYVSIHGALEFRKWLGGEEKINAYCRNLALKGGKYLAEKWGTQTMDVSKDGEFTLNMCNIALPMSPERVPDTPMNRAVMQYKLLDVAKVSAPVFVHNGKWWVRCSAQVWNELSDFEYLGKVLSETCKEVEEENVAAGNLMVKAKL